MAPLVVVVSRALLMRQGMEKVWIPKRHLQTFQTCHLVDYALMNARLRYVVAVGTVNRWLTTRCRCHCCCDSILIGFFLLFIHCRFLITFSNTQFNPTCEQNRETFAYAMLPMWPWLRRRPTSSFRLEKVSILTLSYVIAPRRGSTSPVRVTRWSNERYDTMVLSSRISMLAMERCYWWYTTLNSMLPLLLLGHFLLFISLSFTDHLRIT